LESDIGSLKAYRFNLTAGNAARLYSEAVMENNEKKIYDATRNLKNAKRSMERASARRFSLPPGSSRASVTTANARLTTYCEAVERYEEALKEAYKNTTNIDN
jgi:hypothetical protein